MYTSETVTNFFLNLASTSSTAVSHNRLQTLLYYAHVWWLVIHAEPLLSEPLEYTKYGPLFMKTYFRFKLQTKSDLVIHYRPQSTPEIDEKVANHLVVIWLVYGAIRHMPIGKHKDICGYNSPWHVVHKRKGIKGPISNQALLDHYSDYERLKVMPKTMAIINDQIVKINPNHAQPIERAKKQLTKIVIPNIRTKQNNNFFNPDSCDLSKFALPLTSLITYNRMAANKKNSLKISNKS